MATGTGKKEGAAAKTAAEKKAVVKKEPAVVKKAATAKVTTVKAATVKATAAKVTAVKAAVPKPVEAPEKTKRAKLVRDSFTMPEAEYAVLAQVKKACLKAGVEVKKSQLLRIGLVLLSKTEVPALKKLITGLAPLKAGRPKKDK